MIGNQCIAQSLSSEALGVGRKIERPESPNQKIDAIKAILNLPEEKYLITLLLPARIKSVFAR